LKVILNIYPVLRKPAHIFSFIIPLAVAAMLFFSCSGEGQGELSQIEFSRDTVFFDTVFTQMGSSTEVLIVRNTGSAPITLSNISVASGNSSVFRMNVNGVPGHSVDEVEIDGHDSVYIFLEVTLNPNGGSTPLIYQDSVVFSANGSTKQVQLAVPGQDAYYYYPTDTLFYSNGSILPYSVIPCNTTWKSGKPIVIVGWAVVDSGCTLTVDPGTRVHFFNNGALWVYNDATLRVLGDLNNPVTFQGTRLASAYENQPGQWDRILINEGSTDNIIRNAVIKNGFIGLQCDNTSALGGVMNTPNHLQLENVAVQNMSGIGIFSRNFDITGFNTLVSNCGQYTAAFTYGGNVKFYHSTFVNYWGGSTRNFPCLFISNYYYDGVTVIDDDLNFEMNNGIVYGNVENEFGFDSTATAALNFRFNHCLLRLDPDEPTENTNRYNVIIKNEEPEFFGPFFQDFRIKEGSPAINSGNGAYVQQHISRLLFDLKGSNRTYSGQPDIGAFEY